MSVRDTIDTVNSTVRTLLALTVVVLLLGAGWLGYRFYQAPRHELAAMEATLAKARDELLLKEHTLRNQRHEIGELQEQVSDLKEQVDRLETARRLLKVNHRVADLRVIDQQPRPADGRLITTIEFVEVNDDGAPLAATEQLTVEGSRVYVAYRVAQFDDKYVEAADLHRGTSICLFEKLFGEHQKPEDGYPLDKVGSRPTAYARGGKMSEFEKKIWGDFWNIANDPQRAEQLGIRALQGEAPSMVVRKGFTYRLTLRAAGGLTFQTSKTDTGGSPDAATQDAAL